jgi:hypothetical protein
MICHNHARARATINLVQSRYPAGVLRQLAGASDFEAPIARSMPGAAASDSRALALPRGPRGTLPWLTLGSPRFTGMLWSPVPFGRR